MLVVALTRLDRLKTHLFTRNPLSPGFIWLWVHHPKNLSVLLASQGKATIDISLQRIHIGSKVIYSVFRVYVAFYIAL
jgi:hypothetical protein